MQKKTTKYNYNADFLRFFLALLVIFGHAYYIAGGTPDPLEKYTHEIISLGGIAVMIFFALSGYYITAGLVRSGDKAFLKKRLWRLLPELIITVLICILIVGPIFTKLPLGEYFLNFRTWLYSLNGVLVPYHNLPGVFESNIYNSTVNGSLWTLPVEFLCYVFILIIFKLKFLDLKKNKYMFFIVSILAIIAYIISRKLDLYIIYSAVKPFLAFILGAFLCLNFDLEKISYKFYALLTLLLPILILINNDLTISLAFTIIVPIIVLGLTSKMKQISPKAAALGKLSYAIYLVGFVVQQCLVVIFSEVDGGGMNPYLNFALSSIISIVLAILIKLLADKIVILLTKKRKEKTK